MRTLFVFSIIALGVLLPVFSSAQINLNLDYPTFAGIDLNTNQNLNTVVAWLYYFIVGIAGLAAFVMIVWGGIQWLTSGAIPSQASEARDKLRAAILGLLLILASFLIIQVINPQLTLLNQPGLTKFFGTTPSLNLPQAPGGPGPGAPACSDTIDNDGNGDIDLADPDCAGDPNGTSEGSGSGPGPGPVLAQCEDGIDNDSPPDGLIDHSSINPTNFDPDCNSPGDNDESSPLNSPPLVDAGSAQTVNFSGGSATANLNGTVSDDGLPNPPGAVTTTWSTLHATVTIANPNQVDTTATFTQEGTFLFTLTANDGSGAVSDTVTVTVLTPPSSSGTVTVNASQTFQTISGWEATSQSGQDSPEFSQYANTLFDRAANELGINRIRLEVRSGMENDTDYWSLFDNGNGSLSSAEWRCVRYSTKNDNSSHTSINPSGFKFSELDDKVNKIVKPLQQKLQARGERLHINLNYVAFTKQITGSGCSPSLQYHHDDPDEYAEFILAASLHLKGMGITPDTWEIILEPDNVPQWDGKLIGQAILATAQKLVANGFSNPKFIAPSNTNMGNAISYFNDMANVLGSSNVTKYIEEFSYHRYGGVSDTNLQTIASRANTYNIGTSMLEHIGSGHEDLHKDLKLANNAAWQQFTLAFPGTSDSGGAYYRVDLTNSSNPQVIMNSRTKFLRQYFKFIREGAVRIEASTTNNSFDPVAFINKNGKYVVVVKAGSGGAFTVGGLPAGTYGITYTTGSQYNQSMPDVTITASQPVNASIPSGGVITIYRR